jgi:hypothetical protein
MKKQLIIPLTFILSCIVFANAEGQCKYEKNEVDKFTNQISIATKSESFVREMSTAMSFALTQTGSQKGVKLGLNLNRPYSIAEGNKLYIKTKNGVVELICSKTVITSAFSYIDYILSEKDFEFLKANEITDIRIELADNSNLDRTLESSKAQKLKNLFGCLNLN